MEKTEIYRELISQMNLSKSEKERENIRNRLFYAMYDDIMKWINSSTDSNSVLSSKQEIVSLSWDCFLFSLKYYKPEKNIPILNHFSSYVRFYIKTENRKHWREKTKEKNLGLAEISEPSFPPSFETEYLTEELQEFRRMLDEDLAKVFDDALLSMRASTKERTTKNKPFAKGRYYDRKRIFKIVIDFLLRR